MRISDWSSDVCSSDLLVSRKGGYPHASQSALWVRRVIESWCADEGMFPEDYTIPDSVAIDADLPPSSRFIVNFGVKYKMRRLTFVIQDINSLYTKLSEPNFCDSPSQPRSEERRVGKECVSQ